MRRLSSLSLALSATLALALAPAAMAADCPGADLRPAADNMDQVEGATLCLINAERAAEGLPALVEQGAAQQGVDRVLAADGRRALLRARLARGRRAHRAPAGDRLPRPAGRWTIGENIAWGESYLGLAGEHRQGLDGEPAAPRQHPQRRVLGDRPRDRRRRAAELERRRHLHDRLRPPHSLAGRRADAEEVVADDPSADVEAAAPEVKPRSHRKRKSRAAPTASPSAPQARGKRAKRGVRRGLSMRAIRATAAAEPRRGRGPDPSALPRSRARSGDRSTHVLADPSARR